MARLFPGGVVPDAFERDMACTVADWLRWLPQAVGDCPLQVQADDACVHIGAGQLHLQWRTAEPRQLALVRLPRLQVRFAFSGVAEQDKACFMRRFDLYTQRGGG